MLDEVVKKVAALGLPGTLLAIAVSATGGGYATGILTALGGPFGFVGGLTIFGLLTLISDVIAGSGLEGLLSQVYSERSKTESLGGVLREIENLPITEDLKRKLKSNISGVPESTSKSV